MPRYRISRASTPRTASNPTMPARPIIGADSTMRSNQREPFWATRISTLPRHRMGDARRSAAGSPAAPPRCMKVFEIEVVFGEIARRDPCGGSASARSDRPCPRQSSVATAKPRARRSRTVSKYFSMNSARPWNRQTVPLRPGGGCQRAKRSVDAVARLQRAGDGTLGHRIGGDGDELHGTANRLSGERPYSRAGSRSIAPKRLLRRAGLPREAEELQL